MVLVVVLLVLTVLHSTVATKEESQLASWPGMVPPMYQHVSCPCDVIGPEDAVKNALRQWAQTYYIRGGRGTCQGQACYRADFIGVGHFGWGNGAGGGHYAVLGCTEAQGLAFGGLEFKFQQNVSMKSYLTDHFGYSQDRTVRYILELACTHPNCQYMGGNEPWGFDQYQAKISDVFHASTAVTSRGGVGMIVIAVISVIVSAVMA